MAVAVEVGGSVGRGVTVAVSVGAGVSVEAGAGVEVVQADKKTINQRLK